MCITPFREIYFIKGVLPTITKRIYNVCRTCTMYITTCIHRNTQALHVLYYYSLVRDVHCNRTQYALRCLQLLFMVKYVPSGKMCCSLHYTEQRCSRRLVTSITNVKYSHFTLYGVFILILGNALPRKDACTV